MPKKPNAKQTKFRKIPGVSGYYAGSDGHIYSFRNSKYNQLTEFRHPYANFLSVYMLTGGKEKIGINVHKAVASAFHRINMNKYKVRHKDKNYFNNKPENLNCRKLEKQDIKEEKDTLLISNISDYEGILKKYVGYNLNTAIWNCYLNVKLKKSGRTTFNWLTIFLKSKNLL